ncbi:MAG TPA: hypothetical protein PLB62_02830, partial [Candidatus Sumerlaeota bacterium]|nr:hypothetical protein [Candidatus Sumerlaeota bacterium]
MTTRSRILRSALTAIAVVCLIFSSISWAYSGNDPDSLFLPAKETTARTAAGALRPQETRFRPVLINETLLKSLDLKSETLVSLELFDGTILHGVLKEKWERSPDRFTLIGKVAGQPMSSIVLSTNRGCMVGNIRMEDGRQFMIRYSGTDGIHLLCEIDPSKFKPLHDDMMRPADTASMTEPAQAPAAQTTTAAGPAIVDVM